MTESTKGRDPAKVQSVARALQIVELLGSTNSASGLGLNDVANHIGVSKSTAHNLLGTLCSRGFVTRTLPGPRYMLGMSLLWLGDRVRESTPFSRLAQPVLESLAESSGFTARLFIVDEGQPLYISHVEGDVSIRFNAKIGVREPPHSSAAGKAILATYSDARVREIIEPLGLPKKTEHTITTLEGLLNELGHIREAGYAMDNEEAAIGHACIGASVNAPSGVCVGALSISGLKSWVTDRLPQLSATVVEHANSLNALLGDQATTTTSTVD